MNTNAPPPSLYDLSFDEIQGALGPQGALAAYEDLYLRRLQGSRALDDVRNAFSIDAPAQLKRRGVESGTMTTKYLFEVGTGHTVEAVRIKRRTGHTACVSSQVGCGFGCRFCASGRLGLVRHLTKGEIVQQVLELGEKVNRIVLMGIGEPLHNYDNVLGAIRILRDRRGLRFPTSGITISTIGIPKKLKALREEHLKINLTISLHATTDEVRHSLIPGSRSHSVQDVVEHGLSWGRRHNRRVTFVYLLLPGVNDSRKDARRLIQWFSNDYARVNLMRWNPVEGGLSFKRVGDRELSGFRKTLLSGGVDAVVRDTQGQDIEAACGQLWLRAPVSGPSASLRA